MAGILRNLAKRSRCPTTQACPGVQVSCAHYSSLGERGFVCVQPPAPDMRNSVLSLINPLHSNESVTHSIFALVCNTDTDTELTEIQRRSHKRWSGTFCGFAASRKPQESLRVTGVGVRDERVLEIIVLAFFIW